MNHRITRYFDIQELVCPHVYDKFGLYAWQFFDPRLLDVLLAIREGIEKPIIVNNWEATYFDLNEEKLEKMIKASSGLGIDMFVLDDGWFGKRDLDNCSLGDWYTCVRKLPRGLLGSLKPARFLRIASATLDTAIS